MKFALGSKHIAEVIQLTCPSANIFTQLILITDHGKRFESLSLAAASAALAPMSGGTSQANLNTLAEAIQTNFQRIQFTPDMLPADIVGTEIFRPGQAEFVVKKGPVFSNLVLADEINRAPAKVQSALLEVMQERQVTIGRETHHVPTPFLVMATQNPIESEGTYPLPEAQVDRFMLKVLVDYPTPTEEFVIVDRMTQQLEAIGQVLTTDELAELQNQTDQVYVDPALKEYAVKLVAASRSPSIVGQDECAKYISYGASPRASINMILAGRALAFLRGRTYAKPEDVRDVALDVMRHRIVLSYEALADGVDADQIVARLMQALPLPEVAMQDTAAS